MMRHVAHVGLDGLEPAARLEQARQAGHPRRLEARVLALGQRKQLGERWNLVLWIHLFDAERGHVRLTPLDVPARLSELDELVQDIGDLSIAYHERYFAYVYDAEDAH